MQDMHKYAYAKMLPTALFIKAKKQKKKGKKVRHIPKCPIIDKI